MIVKKISVINSLLLAISLVIVAVNNVQAESATHREPVDQVSKQDYLLGSNIMQVGDLRFDLSYKEELSVAKRKVSDEAIQENSSDDFFKVDASEENKSYVIYRW